MKNEGITQGPLFAVQDSVGAWCVTVGNSRFDQQVAYVGTDNPHVETGSAKGNAQLFAAAPDLLRLAKCCHELLNRISLVSVEANTGADICQGRSELAEAINKAEGRA